MGQLMSSMNLREELRTYLFATLIPMDKSVWPSDEADLFDAGMDSLRLMQLLVFAEEEWKMQLPDHEVTPERIESINALVAWFESRRDR